MLNLEVRCRKCSNCLKARMIQWGNRCKAEWQFAGSQARRTWFGTLTINPEARYRATAQASLRLQARGVHLDALPPVERFAELHREVGPLVTKLFKRMRTGGGSARDGSRIPPLQFRYFLAVEPHEDWHPHYHLLVHELDCQAPIKHKWLKSLWPHGLVDWSLVQDERAAFYAAKYLAKYSVARVRASEHYGEVPTALAIPSDK